MQDYTKTELDEKDLICILSWTLRRVLPTDARELADLLRAIAGERGRIADVGERVDIDTMWDELVSDAAMLELLVPELVVADYEGWINLSPETV